MPLRKIQQIQKKLAGKIVLMRVDFNVSMKSGKVMEDAKIVASVPTISYLRDAGARVVLLSHLGRPKKKDSAYSLRPVIDVLSELRGTPVSFLDLPYWEKKYQKVVKDQLNTMKLGDVTLFENTRFAPGEEEGYTALSKHLASYGDIFVLDGFAVAHRDAASVTGIAKYIPAYAGLLLQQEIAGLSRVLRPKQPSVLVLGGVKMETKIPVLRSLLPRMNSVLLAGGVANTYFAARGYGVGDSVIEHVHKKELLRYAKSKKVFMPVDVIVGNMDGTAYRMVDIPSTSEKLCKIGESILDIGPRTIREYAQILKQARTIVWNGACGYMEVPPYDVGTLSIARVIATVSRGKCFGVVGGGETVTAINRTGMQHSVDLVSTGGGAMLEFLSGKTLPGIRAVSSWWG